MSIDKKDNLKKSSVLAQWRKRKKESVTVHKITPRPLDSKVAPSSGQQRLWLLQKLYPKNPFYQYGHLYKIKGNLNVDLLTKSFQNLIAHHEILRTNFVETAEGVELKIHPTIDFSIEKIETNNNTLAKDDTQHAIQSFVEKTFDLTKDQLLRIGLLKISETEHWMVLSIHHIIGDRSSLLILQQEVFDFYKKNKTVEVETEVKLPLQYTDYAFWKNKQTTDEKQLNFWLKKLEGELPLLELPTDKPRPKRATFNGAIISKKLDSSLSKKIQDLAKEHDTTRFAILLAAFKILLFRYTNQEDILIGSPFSNRDKMELENLIGFFNETLVLRSEIKPDISFHDFIQQIKVSTMQAMEHKNAPFEELVKKINPTRHGSANPLFQAMFVYNNSNTDTFSGLDLEIEDEAIDLKVSKFDLTLFATNHGETLEISLEYALDLFEASTAQRMLQHLEMILISTTNDAQESIAKLHILTQKEREQILISWNNIPASTPQHTSIHSWIEKMATTFPNKKAVVYQDKSITYSALNSKANRLANILLSNNIKPSSPIGLYTARGLEMIIGIVGILKAGAAYLPLDPEYPEERIDFILNDANAEFVFCQKKLEIQLEKTTAKVIAIEDILENDVFHNHIKPTVKGDDLAYIIYTSGSTGKPKGVPISHRNLIHSTHARFDFFKSQPDAFLLLSSFSFDSSVAGIFWTLCSGGTLVLPPRRIEQDIQKLAKIIQINKISHTLLLPSLYNLLLEHATDSDLQFLKTVMVAGEACPTNLVLNHYKKLPKVNLVNEYGPTEGTVWSTAHHILPSDAFGSVPIGRPIPSMENYILDKNLQPVPVGVIGELYIGGKGIANGYWQRPELTQERFIPHPFNATNKIKIYKTGDLAKFRQNGVIDFLGRADHQVKIRGHRIEPDEIKSVLEKMDGVKDAVIVVQKNQNHNRLIAYLTMHFQKEKSIIRTALKEVFPDYMIPAAFVQLDEFPKLPNGKIDLKNLPTPDKDDLIDKNNFTAPSTEVEKQLATIWEKVLKISPIGLHDNFFEIGGDSIQSIQVIAKAQKAGIELAPNQLFEYQTIGGLANFLSKKEIGAETKDEKNNWSSIVTLNKKGSRPPLFCIHSGGGHIFFYQPLAKRLSPEQPLYALQPMGLDGKQAFHSSIEEMAIFYIQEIKKIQPVGPYHLLGTCFSNAVGLEIANQLRDGGDEIALLIIVDSGPQYLLGATERGEKKTASRFVKMIKEKDWKGIQKKFRNRFIRAKQKALAPLENEQERNLRLTIQNLNQLYHHYSWRPYDGTITFIRSSEFAQRKEKDIHIKQWTKLAKSGLDIHVTEGHHVTLFAEPEVEGLAVKIKECMELILNETKINDSKLFGTE